MGAWLTYGLGAESDSLPGFVVLQSGPRGPRGGASLYGSGFLPSVYQGVPFLKGPNPILDLAPPPGVDGKKQGEFVDAVNDLNKLRHDATGDPEIQTRIAAYEMAYRMQTSAPELMDLSKEAKKTLDMYGAEPGKPSFAANCLLARRLVQRGVRFIQLYHTDWDHHGGSLDLDETARHDLQGSRPAVRRADQGSEAARDAGQHASWCGAASSAARRWARAARRSAATTTSTRTRCGSPAAASSRARCTASPTKSATT